MYKFPAARVLAIAHRPHQGQAMRLSDDCKVSVGRGLDLENRNPGRRNITLLSMESWSDVCRALPCDLPWHTRRANLLVEGVNLESWVGKPIVVGEVRLWIWGETRPCELMETLHPGLRAALRSGFRGGVFGQVLIEGTIRVGDALSLGQDQTRDVEGSVT